MQPARLDLEKDSASNGSNLVTRLSGKLSLETVHNFIQTMRPEPAEHLVLEMSGVSFLDSAGVGALVSLFVHRRNAGKSFALAGLTQQGNAVLQVVG
jgi:anti-sigma B factor antagonist